MNKVLEEYNLSLKVYETKDVNIAKKVLRYRRRSR